MKGVVRLEDIGEIRIEMDWARSIEYREAYKKFLVKPDKIGEFQYSQEFANARHAFRKRINGKKDNNWKDWIKVL